MATATGDGWHRVQASGATVASMVAAKNGSTCGTTFGGLTGGTVFLVALNAGDTSASDAGVKGGFDTVAITSAAGTTTYDFEPLPPTQCTVDCGAGVDRVVADRGDVLRNCENVTRR